MQVNRFGYYWLLANIAEGNSRHSTSKETEMWLTDVARASLAELANSNM